ncbi:MAG TPA: hypothetical protein VHX40_06500 [Acidimicrobiales bacterium]|nr:hypothetical protein [Acidimicrobiales bacterium]
MGLGLAKRTNRSAACPAPLRRVEWVRVTVEGRSVRAEAIGVGYRLPATCRISMAMAADLARQGVPLSVWTIDGDRVPNDDESSGDQPSGDHADDGRAVEAGR